MILTVIMFYKPTFQHLNEIRDETVFPLFSMQLHLQRLPQPAHQLTGGVHGLPVQHHCQRGLQPVVRRHH